MTRREIDALLAQFEPRLRDAFIRAINETVDAITLLRVVEALERRDIDAAIRAVGLDPAAFGPLQLAISETYYAAGMGEAAGIRARDPDGNRVVFRFGVRDLPAEEWLRTSSASLVTGVTDDAVIGMRNGFAAGLARGDNPRTTALDVIGRVSRSTGRREGGIIGLTSQQAGYVDRARDNLLSGDPARMREYLTLGRRDKRFDRTVLKAIREGRALTREEVTKITGRLADSYLQLRGETIARHETMQAMAKGRDDAIRQAVAAGKIEAETTTKTWRNAADGRVRPTHQHGSLGGQTVPLDQPFVSASGARLRYPHDPQAPTSETLGCFAPWTKIGLAGLKCVISRHYEGELVELSAGGVVNLAVTPNHPILTDRGWVPAGQVVEGDHLVYCGRRDGASPGGAMDVEHAHARAEQLGNAANALGQHLWSGLRGVNFHGEVPEHEVNVVAFPVELRDRFEALSSESFAQVGFTGADVEAGSPLYARLVGAGDGSNVHGFADALGRSSTGLPGFGTSQRGREAIAQGDARPGDAEIIEAGRDHGAADAKFLGDAVDGVSRIGHAANVGVERRPRSEVPTGGSDSLGPAADLMRSRLEAEVGEAALHHSDGNADALGNGASREVHVSEGFDLVKVGRAGGGEPRSNSGASPLSFSAIRVNEVRHNRYSGMVFNFETTTNLIISEGVIVHNCRCWVDYKMDFFARVVRRYQETRR